jgi:hypothetical protein
MQRSSYEFENIAIVDLWRQAKPRENPKSLDKVNQIRNFRRLGPDEGGKPGSRLLAIEWALRWLSTAAQQAHRPHRWMTQAARIRLAAAGV